MLSDALRHGGELLLHDAVLTLQTQTHVPLLLQLELVLFLELVNLEVGVLLELVLALVPGGAGVLELKAESLGVHLLILKFTAKLFGELRHDPLVRRRELVALLVPSAVELLLLLHERLVPFNLVQDFVLER